MNKKAIYAGCLMGVVAVACLFYPLYVVLPGSYFAGWQSGSGSLGIILSTVTAVALIVAGLLAARWAGTVTRRQGAKLGALAGGIAGTMAFAALGAGAAGTIGLGAILLRGTQSAAGDAPFTMTSAVVQIANLTYAALWIMSLGGAALGALGGLMASPRAAEAEKENESALHIAEVISNRLLLVSLLMLVVSVATTPILLGSQNVSQQQDTTSLFNWSVGSAFVVYLAILMWILSLIQYRLAQNIGLLRKRQANTHLYIVSVASVLALVVMVLILLSGGTSQESGFRLLVNPVFLVGLLVSLSLIGYMLKMAGGLSRQLRPSNDESQAEDERARAKAEAHIFLKKENILLTALISGAAFGLPPLTLVPLVINLARGVAPTMALLAKFEGTVDPTRPANLIAVGIVQDVFLSQMLVAYGVFLLGAVSILFSLSFARGISRLLGRG